MATATILPFPRFVAYDQNGAPLVGGFVYTYVPATTTPKTTWQDAAETIPNANPITLDAAGSCLLYGDGNYQITTTDSLGNQIPAYTGLSQDVIASFNANPKLFPTIANIAALRASTIITLPQSAGYVEGYFSSADGGEGAFVFVPTDTTSADNNGTIIVDGSGRRWYREIDADYNLLWFGGKGDGITDNLAALNSLAIAIFAQTGGGSIVIPPGKYRFTAQATLTWPAGRIYHLGISGVGATLYWPNAAGGLVCAMSEASHSVVIDGPDFTTGVAAGGTGLMLTQSHPLDAFIQSSIRNVIFRGDDNAGSLGSFYWDAGAQTSDLSGTNWDAVTCFGANLGTGIKFQGTGSTAIDYSIIHNLSKCIFGNLTIGVVYGAYAQGVTITQSNFNNCIEGVAAPAGELGALSQLQISDSQFLCTTNNIIIASSIGNVFIHDNDIFVQDGYAGILLNAYQGASISNNQIAMPGTPVATTYGIFVNGTVAGAPATITGNTTSNGSYGIYLGPGTSDVLVASNVAINYALAAVHNGGAGNVIGVNLP